jgi:alpha-galactosidase
MMKTLVLAAFLFLLNISCFAQPGLSVKAPPDSPATVMLRGNALSIIYDGQTILSAIIANDPSSFYFREVKDSVGGKIFHAFTLTSNDGSSLTLEGTITASGQSFPCEENRATGSTFVRHSVGLSHSRLNRAVYDRAKDWSLSVEQAATVIIPLASSPEQNTYSINVTGREICFLFKPRYYQKHRGLSYFEPWNYRVWSKPVVGWSSWFAYFDKVTADDVMRTADVLSETLKPYGLEYIQIDDGYQQETSYPEKWTTANEKFPGSLPALSKYISDKGLKPGIWTNVAFSNKSWAFGNRSLFVRDTNDEPVKGRWIGYVMDGSNPETLDKLIRPVYRNFKETGWKYYKLDALRHLRYEGYNSNTGYFNKKKTDRVEAFRNVVKAVRSEIGKDNFLLACWGIRPELIGIVDACRIGDDGYGMRTLTQYNSFNNVIWRNDPDHIELKGRMAYASCMVTSMTGSLFMLTDKPEVYGTPLVEAAMRSIPVLFTLPGQIYDVDPSASMYLDRLGSELSGSGVRVFDARLTSPYTDFLLEINKPYESWMLLGRTDESRESASFAELGLDPAKEYLVFEFWTQQLTGNFMREFHMGKIDPGYGCQLFCIREKQDNPQLLATNRHISCGGLELEELKWNTGSLCGKSMMVANDTYTLYIYEPVGSVFTGFKCESADLISITAEGKMRVISIKSSTGKTISWEVTYK